MDYQEQLRRMGKYEEPKPIEKEEPKPKKEIDWEQRRYEIAKDALIGCVAMPIIPNTDPYRRPNEMAELAVEYADALIEELKKTSK